MPQNDMNLECRRRGMCCNSWKATAQVLGTGLVNGAIVHNGCQAAATRTNESTPAGTLNGANPQCMVNGYINHRSKGKSRKAPLPRTHRKQEGPISAVTDALAAGGVSSAAVPGGISVNGATSLDTVASPCNSDRMAPEPSRLAAAKKKWRYKKYGRKKRPPPRPPQKEEEDWENEIQDVMLTDWETMCFGVGAYGPEDVLDFALRDLTLAQMDTVDPPMTANYSPAMHHPLPVGWSCYNTPTEPDQFADADE